MFHSRIETIDPEPPCKPFQFSLQRLMVFSICTGAGIVYSPLLTIIVLIVIVIPAVFIKSWIEWLVVLGVFGFLIALLMPLTSGCGCRRKRSEVRILSMALEHYHSDFAAYPPEDIRSLDSSESLVKYLIQPVQTKNRSWGPYIEMPPSQIKDSNGDGKPELFSRSGAKFFYRTTDSGKFTVIDPGKDGLIGGTFTKAAGFVPNSRDANGDGVADDKDNIYSNP
jgi:hypothetical protein